MTPPSKLDWDYEIKADDFRLLLNFAIGCDPPGVSEHWREGRFSIPILIFGRK
jgi:hypothetical protein